MAASTLLRLNSTFRLLERLSAASNRHAVIFSIPLNNGILIRPRPTSSYCSSDLKGRGLRSIEKFIDVRQAELLKADMFEDRIFASKRPRKESIFAVKNEHPNLPAETQLQSRNRNPRNMELLGYNKPRGYGTLYRKRDFWNRFIFT